MAAVVLALPGADRTARRLARLLKASLGKMELRRFPDGETYLRLKTRVERRQVIVVAALDRPDDRFLSLLFVAAAARDLGACTVGLVAPYLPYMRQDKRFRTGEAITSTYFARIVSEAFDWLVTVDPHLHRHKSLSEIYSIPATAVHAAPLIARWIRKHVPRSILVGPDSESTQWVAAVADLAGAPFTVLSKRRLGDRSVQVSPFRPQDGPSRTPVLVDDIVSTARTMIETVKQVRAQRAPRPWCLAVHALFVDDAYRQLRTAGPARIITCDTVAHPSNGIEVAPALAAAIARHIEGCP